MIKVSINYKIIKKWASKQDRPILTLAKDANISSSMAEKIIAGRYDKVPTVNNMLAIAAAIGENMNVVFPIEA